MRWLTFFIFLLIGTLLDAGGLLDIFAIGGAAVGPDVLITLLVFYAVTCRPHEAISCCFIIGIAADLAAGVMGPHFVCYGLLGTMLNTIARSMTVRHAVQQAGFVFAVYLIAEIAAYWLNLLRYTPNPNAYSIFLLTAIFSAILCPLIWSLLAIFSGWAGLENTGSNRSYY